MGWGAPTGGSVRTQAVGQFWQGKLIANLKGFNVILLELDEMPDTSVQREVDKAFFKQFAERITIFQTPTLTSWLWPRKRSSGFLAAEKYEHATGSIPDYLSQKLAAISFTVSDHTRGITLGQVRDKVRGQFDTSAVTKKFYEDFKTQHEALTSQIQGLPETQAHSYSSLLLNRLMFIYFLQKKEFINNDANYLRTCLEQLQKLNTDVKFYSFYKDLLRTLFFDGLNRQPHEFTDPKIAEILGDPPYINGGIFGASEIEQTFEIEIPDKAFEDIFNLFDSYRWHLDTSPTGNSNEINPEVIGYIFEQYINYTADGKKDKGAYYTPKDVCGYMARSTIIPHLLGTLGQIDSGLHDLVKLSAKDFITSDMLHGWDSSKQNWSLLPDELLRCWNDDPAQWAFLDELEFDADVNLPGETWVETLHRRERVDRLLGDLSSGAIGQHADDFVTYPLEGLGLLDTYLRHHAGDVVLNEFWITLEKLKLIDPTCGSGAFLFGAMEVLEDVYSALLAGVKRTGTDLGNLSNFNIEMTAPTQSNERYFIRKAIAIHNLYGTDIMPDAIETAKLRLFLSLVACLETKEQLEPLPDLDFNLKVANLVVGFYDADDSARISQDLWIRSSLDDLKPQIEQFKLLHSSFNELSKSASHTNIHLAKKEVKEASRVLRNLCNEIYRQSIDSEMSIEDWVEANTPFHWFIEFPEIIENGGFDIVIGNPPYIRKSKLSLEIQSTLIGYETFRDKNPCPDFYAVCYERSLQILKPSGRHSMIVMLSLACGEKFAPLRNLIAQRGASEWWSTFGRLPDGLFAGARVRNTILTLSKGKQQFSTSHNIFTKQGRGHLLTTLNYTPVPRHAGECPNRGGIAHNIVDRINKSWRVPSPVEGPVKSVYTLRTASYWYPILPSKVPIIDDDLVPRKEKHEGLLEIVLRNFAESSLGLVLLGSKLSYLFFSSTSDDLNCGPQYGEKVLGLLSELTDIEEVSGFVPLVTSAAKDNYFATKNDGKLYLNIRWSSLRAHTDLFEKALLGQIGLEQDRRALNIWYRQTMRSGGDGPKSIPVSADKAKEYIDWYRKNIN
jgi:type I restriction-modification system DNA methylase subunit